MKKIYLIFTLIMIFPFLISAQQKKIQKVKSETDAKALVTLDSVKKSYIIAYAERDQGRFTIKTNKWEELLFSESSVGGGKYTSHANFKIGGQLFTQSKNVSTGGAVLINVSEAYKDTNRIRYTFNDLNGVRVVQELIPKINIRNQTGAVLIKYTFTNNNSSPITVGAALLLDTKIGGYDFNTGNDHAPISSSAGLKTTSSYFIPVPNFWMAFENLANPNAMIGFGTLVGNELVKPDKLFVGEFGNMDGYTYNKTLAEGAPYGDSEIMMEWKEIPLQPGETRYFSTLYGTQSDVQGNNLRLVCKSPFDTLTLNPAKNYEINPFEYGLTVLNPGLTIFNVKAEISFNNNVFYLDNPATAIYNFGDLAGGDTKVFTWNIYAKNQFVGKDDTIKVKVTGDGISDEFCYTTMYVPANRARLSAYVLPKNSGTLNINPPPPADSVYQINQSVTLTAVPNSCYALSNWSGDASGSANPLTIVLDRNKTVIANTQKASYELKVSSLPSFAGTVKYTGTSNTVPTSSNVECGTNISLTPTPNSGFRFTGWSGGDATGNTIPLNFAMDKAKNIIANFENDSFSLVININPPGSGLTNPGSGRYLSGSNVSITATPNNCYSFVGWSGPDTTNISNNPISVRMWKNKTITANFKKDSFVVLAGMVNTETNQVDGTVGSILKSPDKQKYECGEKVKITAFSSNYCYRFKNWNNDALKKDSIIEFTINKDTTLFAFYDKKQFKLDIKTDGQGTVDLKPQNANNTYKCGDPVQITANPAKCWSFLKFNSGPPLNIDTTINPITIPMMFDITGTAFFRILEYKLITSVTPFGSGRVNTKINDTTIYKCGDNVTLLAEPDPCYTFLRWSDGDTTNPKKVTINSQMNLQAIFKIKRFSIATATDYGDAGGSVIKSPDSLKYDCGRTISVSIVPNCNFSFVKWSGDVKGTNTSYPILLDSDKSVLANMAQIKFRFLRAQHNVFPNIVLDFRVDSIWADKSTFRVRNIQKEMLTIQDGTRTGTKINQISKFGFYPQTDTTFKVVYSLDGCYGDDNLINRSAKMKLSLNKCSQDSTLDYTIPLNSGCDSCAKILRRKDTTKVYFAKLYVNHPNPFNPETRIRYSISKPDFTTLIVYDMLGREIRSLVSEFQESGEYEVTFSPIGLPTGVYFYKIRSGSFMDIKKMLYVK